MRPVDYDEQWGHTVTNGFLYVATGPLEIFEESLVSVRSLKRVSPNAHASIVVTGTLPDGIASRLDEAFDFVNHVELPDIGDDLSQSRLGHLLKVTALRDHAPYDRTMFVDADTYFVEPLDELFATLDYFDLLVAVDPVDIRLTRDDNGDVVAGVTPYNTGLIAFSPDRTRSLMADWTLRHEVLTRETPPEVFVSDQASFTSALLRSDSRFLVLQPTWNARLPYPGRFSGQVRMIHSRPREMRRMSLERAAERVNQTHGVRVWLPYLNETISRDVGLVRWLAITARNLRHLAGTDIGRWRSRLSSRRGDRG